MANSLLGQEPRTVDKRIEATIRDELDYLNKYGADYWNSGTTGLLGWGAFSAAQQSLGASGRGERAWNNLNDINFKMKGGYSQEELWNMFNDELINTFPENDDYRLSIELMDREENYGGGKVKREGYRSGGISRLASKGAKAIKGLLGKKGAQAAAAEEGAHATIAFRKKNGDKLRQYFTEQEKEIGFEEFGDDSYMADEMSSPYAIYKKDIDNIITQYKEGFDVIEFENAYGKEFNVDARYFDDRLDDILLVSERNKAIRKADEVSNKPDDDLPFSKGGRVAKAKGGTTEDQMNALAISVAPARVEEQETHTMPDGTVMPGATHEEYEQQLPDEEMEADYVDYVVDETLSAEDQDYLDSALTKDARLSGIFDQVVESAAEFSGSGPIEGPGSEVSDSIPARLSDGEFVFTAKAVEEIGADVLQQQMKAAESKAEGRQNVVHGGMVEDEGDPKAVPIQTRGSVAAQGNIPNVAKQSRQVEEEMLKSSPRRYYVPVSG